MNASSVGETAPKKVRLPKKQREAAAVALSVAGLTQQQIATELGVERKAVGRYLAEAKPSTEVATSILERAQATLEKIWPIEQRMEKVADLGRGAKNEAVSLAAIGMANDIGGLINDKERLRAKSNDHPTTQPLFALPAGAQVNVSVTHVQTPEKCITIQKEPDNTGENE